MRCGECGSKKISIKDIRGKSFPWMDYPSVTLNVSLTHPAILTCDECQNVLMRSSGMEPLDQAIEESIRNNLSEKNNEAWTKPIPDYGTYLKIINR